MSCRIQRVNNWTRRLMDELDKTKESCFITLTYNDENMTPNNSLSIDHHQKFIKRLRWLTKRKLKYFMVGEYGDTTKRPHYHYIIFGWNPSESYRVDRFQRFESSKELDKLWPYGFNSFGRTEHDSIQYVAGYATKKLYGVLADDEYKDGRIPMFMRCSQALGLHDDINLKKTYKGNLQPIPRYYIKKEKIPKEFIERRQQEGQEKSDKNRIYYESRGQDYETALAQDRERRAANDKVRQEHYLSRRLKEKKL